MKRQLRAGARRLAEQLAPTVMASISDVPRLRAEVRQAQQRAATATKRTMALRHRVEKLERRRHAAAERQIRQLQDRVASLETELRLERQLNRHVAEVIDVVQEVLLPATSRDDDLLREALDRYRDSF
ncbi:DUF6752 domain-containing protein [Haloechinothrix halophila]|uniref:DUF6752 domain-containing protein n=1 Tax=Haloechinothrix halophila TaxID=1069073 RepID=UPI0012F75EEF|nr:DUF6752 domain-containing protein [Haloechinothrix halophila]